MHQLPYSETNIIRKLTSIPNTHAHRRRTQVSPLRRVQLPHDLTPQQTESRIRCKSETELELERRSLSLTVPCFGPCARDRPQSITGAKTQHAPRTLPTRLTWGSYLARLATALTPSCTPQLQSVRACLWQSWVVASWDRKTETTKLSQRAEQTDIDKDPRSSLGDSVCHLHWEI